MKNDKELLRAYLSGNDQAFKILYQRYYPRLFNFIRYGYVYNSADVEDILQDTFIRLAFRADQYDSQRGCKFSTWLYTIAKHRALDFSQKQRTDKTLGDALHFAETEEDENRRTFVLKDPKLTPELEQEVREQVQQVRQAMKQISPQFARVIQLRDFEGYSYKEIANLTKTSIGTVKSRLHRGRRMIRRHVD